MSSSFRSSHRRSRSHSSLSTFISAPLTRADPRHRITRSPDDNVSHSLCLSPTGSSDALSHFTSSTQPPGQLEDVPIGGHGKEARHGYTEDVDMDSHNSLSPISFNTMLSPSALPTMHFPSTSDAFQFFPSKATAASRGPPSVPVLDAYMHTNEPFHANELSQLHSDAFSDLRRSVTEAGEGFVRRMREFEACRTGEEPLHVSLNLSDSGAFNLKESHQKRGRKRPSSSFSRCRAQKRSSASSRNSRRYKSDESDERSDIEIHSGSVSGSDDYSILSPAKKRAISLGALSDSVGINLQSHLRSLPYPIPLRRRARSRPPSAYTTSSEDESDLANGIYPERMQQSRAVHNLYDTPPSPKSSTPSFSFSPTSNNSSQISLTIPQVATSGSLSSSPAPPSSGPFPLSSSPSAIDVSKKRTEKTIAALNLALANGAGSVSDYEALREAQGAIAMGDSDAGSLWD